MKTIGIKLNEEEQKLFTELKKIHTKIEEGAKHSDSWKEKERKAWKALWAKGAKPAFHLYMSLISRDEEVLYPPALIHNRYEDERCSPENYRFYVHTHSMQYLIKCIEKQPTAWWRD